MIKKNTLIGENCYRFENGKNVAYRVTSKAIKNFMPHSQSNAFEKLEEVKDLIAKAPKDSSGYTGWALHYMYFLQKRGCIGELDFKPLNRKFNTRCDIERKMNQHIENWFCKQELKFKEKMQCLRNPSGTMLANKCILSNCSALSKASLIITLKDFDQNELYFKFAFETGLRPDGFHPWLKENGYISYHEEIDFDTFVPLAF